MVVEPGGLGAHIKVADVGVELLEPVAVAALGAGTAPTLRPWRRFC
ncbi:hypothetical protein ACFPBZ_04905 [Actinomycetospora atypica]|uniref:Uncharacterized protein n=1 Tax=Actinomycetospora atypica TaxID=1290095 RepID=A0ABV9YGT0_9PSEU